MIRPAAFSASAAKICCELVQPTRSGPHGLNAGQCRDNMGSEASTQAHPAIGIGRPAWLHLPGYADRPILRPNCS
jgi:hypothetical protein